jgi:hypothetical protein
MVGIAGKLIVEGDNLLPWNLYFRARAVGTRNCERRYRLRGLGGTGLEFTVVAERLTETKQALW